jgi:hypothetical protein
VQSEERLTRNGEEKSHLKLPLINMFQVQVALVGVTFHNSEIMLQGAVE